MSGEGLKVGQIAITVVEVARATAFYRDKVGLPFLFAAGGMAFFGCGGVRLMLSASQSGKASNSIIYYKTSDLSAFVEEMTGRGVIFEQGAHLIAKMPDHELWMAFFRDSEGNLCGLMSEVFPEVVRHTVDKT